MPETIAVCCPVPRESLEAARAEFAACRWLSTAPDDGAELSAATIIYGKPTDAALRACAQLKWLQAPSAGVEKLAAAEAFLNGSFILTTAAGMHAGCAEHAIALLLAVTRRLAFYGTRFGPGQWKSCADADAPRTLKGSCVGVLGLGAIGRHICEILRAMGVRTLGISRSGAPTAEADETHAVADLDRVLPRCDALILILPATAETDNLIDARRLALLPAHCVLVNVGRGNAIDEDALIAALRSGKLAGAGLDVYKTEPLPADSPLHTLANAVLTPHIGGDRPDYHGRAWDVFIENLRRYLRGETVSNRVEKQRGY